jgi:hypothetical protein
MRQILQTTLLTEAESLRLALYAEGITAAVSGRPLSGILPNAFSVWIARDDDLERALAVRDQLHEGASPGLPEADRAI